MSHRRIGELLRNLVPLSEQDVEEILHEQVVTRRRFGEIAMAWGLCDPAHVWKAWADQAKGHLHRVDLRRLGVDAQATEYMPADVARELGAIPFRCFDELVVVAVAGEAARDRVAESFKPEGKQVAFVLAEGAAIEAAIASIYGSALKVAS